MIYVKALLLSNVFEYCLITDIDNLDPKILGVSWYCLLVFLGLHVMSFSFVSLRDDEKHDVI